MKQHPRSSNDFNADVTGTANLDLAMSLTADVSDVSLVDTNLVVDWSDITDLATFSADITGDVDLTGALESIAMDYVVDVLLEAVGFLQESQQSGVFQTDIPLINRDLADLLNMAEKLDAIAQDLQQNPPQTINAALERLESPRRHR